MGRTFTETADNGEEVTIEANKDWEEGGEYYTPRGEHSNGRSYNSIGSLMEDINSENED